MGNAGFVDGKWPEIDWESGFVIQKGGRDVIKAMECNSDRSM